MQIQWFPDITPKCQWTGKVCSLKRGNRHERKKSFNKFVRKRPKCSLYRGLDKTYFTFKLMLVDSLLFRFKRV